MAVRKPEQKTVNDVNVRQWFDTIELIEKQPDVARFRLRAHNKWVRALNCRTTIKDFYGAGKEDSHARAFELEADEPAVLLGTDKGPNATEAALYALASCLNTTFMYHASANGVTVKELTLELEGDLDLRGVMGIDEGVRNGFTEIRATFKVKADAPKEKIEELCRKAQQRSPVFDIVTHEVPVKVWTEIA